MATFLANEINTTERDITGPTPHVQIVFPLKGPSQPPPFSMPSKLFTLYGESKCYCFSVHCAPEGMFDDLW